MARRNANRQVLVGQTPHRYPPTTVSSDHCRHNKRFCVRWVGKTQPLPTVGPEKSAARKSTTAVYVSKRTAPVVRTTKQFRPNYAFAALFSSTCLSLAYDVGD